MANNKHNYCTYLHSIFSGLKLWLSQITILTKENDFPENFPK